MKNYDISVKYKCEIMHKTLDLLNCGYGILLYPNKLYKFDNSVYNPISYLRHFPQLKSLYKETYHFDYKWIYHFSFGDSDYDIKPPAIRKAIARYLGDRVHRHRATIDNPQFNNVFTNELEKLPEEYNQFDYCEGITFNPISKHQLDKHLLKNRLFDVLEKECFQGKDVDANKQIINKNKKLFGYIDFCTDDVALFVAPNSASNYNIKVFADYCYPILQGRKCFVIFIDAANEIVLTEITFRKENIFYGYRRYVVELLDDGTFSEEKRITDVANELGVEPKEVYKTAKSNKLLIKNRNFVFSSMIDFGDESDDSEDDLEKMLRAFLKP